MKKLVFVLLTLVTFNVTAQLVVKEAAKDTVIWQLSKLNPVPKLVRFKLEDVESYTIYYKNAQYTAITDIDYISIGDSTTTRQFFELCKQVIAEDKEYNVELDNKDISLRKTLGTVMIYTSGSYFYLSDKNLTAILERL
jgi:hypothetical protein